MLSKTKKEAKQSLFDVLKKANQVEFYEGGDATTYWNLAFQLNLLLLKIRNEAITEDESINVKLSCLIKLCPSKTTINQVSFSQEDCNSILSLQVNANDSGGTEDCPQITLQ